VTNASLAGGSPLRVAVLVKQVPRNTSAPVAIELTCDRNAAPNLCVGLELAFVKTFHSIGEACRASAAAALIQTDLGRHGRQGYAACEPGQVSIEGMTAYRLEVTPIRREVHRGKASFSVREFYEAEMTIVGGSGSDVLARTAFFSSFPSSFPSMEHRCPSFESRVAELLPAVFPR